MLKKLWNALVTIFLIITTLALSSCFSIETSELLYIYMLLEIFPVSPRGFESFTRRFGSPFGAIFKRGGGWSTWS